MKQQADLMTRHKLDSRFTELSSVVRCLFLIKRSTKDAQEPDQYRPLIT